MKTPKKPGSLYKLKVDVVLRGGRSPGMSCWIPKDTILMFIETERPPYRESVLHSFLDLNGDVWKFEEEPEATGFTRFFEKIETS